MPEAVTVYRPADYPHGCRCSSCDHTFTDGDPLHRVNAGWLAGVSWVSPACQVCVDAGLGVPGVVALWADGELK